MEVLHELGCKLRASITDYLPRDSKLFPCIVVEKFGSSHGGYLSGGRDGSDVLGESVDNHHYCVISLQYR